MTKGNASMKARRNLLRDSNNSDRRRKRREKDQKRSYSRQQYDGHRTEEE